MSLSVFSQADCNDVSRWLARDAAGVILDVGANIGSTAKDFAALFPAANIYAIEPIKSTYDELLANVADLPKIKCFNLGLSRHAGVVSMLKPADSVASRIIDRRYDGFRYEDVEVVDGDAFLAKEGIRHVDFLKIDTEGHDLDVLFGLSGALRQGKISFIMTEAGANITNISHVPLGRIVSFLEPFGYHLFKICNQSHESGKPMLRRVDAIFCKS